MSNALLRGLALSTVGFLAACGSSSKPGGAGGDGAGGGGGGGGGSSGAQFMAVAPCAAASDYVAADVIKFPNADMSYSPKCARVAAGATVTFMATGTTDFAAHSLEPSRRRGNTTDNPITTVSSGTSREFTFSSPGFFAYYCGMHGIADMDDGEVGVIWVQ